MTILRPMFPPPVSPGGFTESYLRKVIDDTTYCNCEGVRCACAVNHHWATQELAELRAMTCEAAS
jgi:hypothetical protein